MNKPIKQFRLKKEYLSSVPDEKYMVLSDLVGKIIVQGDSYACKDHPEFTKLRNKLCELGYIFIEPTYWNGDRVLKPFKLNKLSFKKGEQFPCAAAIAVKSAVLNKNENCN
jgi:hypothetical protein